MPPSFDTDSTSGPSLPGKHTQKSPLAGAASTKHGRKNGQAKEMSGGGVMAAVTKGNASKAGNNKPSNTPNHPPQVQIPEAKTNGSAINSPLLDALSSAALASSLVSQNTNEWAKNVPPYSSSPNNLINLGESPPTVPSSYEDKPTNFGWNRESKGIASPPSRRRPLSYEMDGSSPYQSEEYTAPKTQYVPRRSSIYSQHSVNQAARFGSQPPLPHQPQAHFYGAPDVNHLLSPKSSGLIPGEHGFYFGFDNLASAHGPLKPADSVIVTGFEGGLTVYSVTKRGTSKITSLDGLRGGVFNAKILPWTAPQANSDEFPLIAVVVHGPVWSSGDSSSEGNTESSSEAPASQPGSLRGSPRSQGQPLKRDDPSTVKYYQTTVEVYSLNTKRHVSTLLALPKSELAMPSSNPLFVAPPPAGSLTIRADRGNLAISSGITGEVWIFRQRIADHGLQVRFICIGKVWTTTPSDLSEDLRGTVDAPPSEASKRAHCKSAIVSLNGRWLAYCPATPSSQIHLGAAIPEVVAVSRVPGLMNHAPPQLPSTNCVVEIPDGGSVMGKIAQVATQSVISGVEYGSKQVGRYWNSYWNKTPQQSNGQGQYQNQPISSNQFPPTHGALNHVPPVIKDPGLVSILDLDALAQQASGYSPHPLATFVVPHGCSFLSLAPTGLALFTAGSKGDVQFVWDLMRIQYSKSSLLKGHPSAGPALAHVRQVAQFSRMTVARIVDVVWTSPHGERAAFVTEPGTVHVLDLPASAFTWPPPRRKVVALREDDTGGDVTTNVTTTALSAVNVASSAVNSLWTAARPLVTSRRRSSVGLSTITAASVTSQAGHGTHALAAGISRSVGAATGRMNEMRKANRTKLYLPKSSALPSPNCVRLINGKGCDTILAVGGGVVRLYTVKGRQADRTAEKQKAGRSAKFIEFRLPMLPDWKVAPGVMEVLDITGREIEHYHWRQRQSPVKTSPSRIDTSIPQAEIESNAPYQPFHTDRRVGLNIYVYGKAPLQSPSVSTLLASPSSKDQIILSPSTPLSPWAFGGPMRSVKLDVGPSQSMDDDSDSPEDFRALHSSAIERVMKFPDSKDNEQDQIVLTTRRRKGAARADSSSADVDEDGFFEDDLTVIDFADQRV